MNAELENDHDKTYLSSSIAKPFEVGVLKRMSGRGTLLAWAALFFSPLLLRAQVNFGNDVGGSYIDSDGNSHAFFYISAKVSTLSMPAGATSSYLTGDDGGNDAAGYFLDSSGAAHAFLYGNGTLLTLPVPAGTTNSYATCNFGNDVAGNYIDSGGTSHAFIYGNGTFVTLPMPAGTTGSYVTDNNGGSDAVGYYLDSGGTAHAFYGNGATVLTLPTPAGTTKSYATCNFGNDVAGNYIDSGGTSHAFIYANGSLLTLPMPAGTTGSYVTDNNGGNDAAGYYVDSGGAAHAFFYGNGTLLTLPMPAGTTNSYATCNFSNDVAGNYIDSGGTSHAFIYANGTFVTLPVPAGTAGSYVTDNNGGSDAVGYYFDSGGAAHAFYGNGAAITTLPMPAGTSYQVPTPHLTLANLNFSYTGGPQGAVVTTNPPGLNVTYTYTGSAIEPTNAGSYTVVATVHNPIFQGSATGTFVIAQSSQAISFSTIPDHTFGDASFALSATAPGGPVNFSVVSGPANITVSEGVSTLAITGAGTITLAADQAGNTNYSAAPEVTGSFTVDQAPQTISFPTIPDHIYGGAPFALNATAPGGPVSFSVSSGPASIAVSAGVSTLTITGAGQVTLAADQAGNTNYSAAPEVTGSFTVDQAPQTISFSTIPDHTYGDAPFALNATAPGGSVNFSVLSGPANIAVSGGVSMLTITGAGQVTLAADQAGNTNYSAAPEVTGSFTVNQAAQTISFPTIPDHTYGDAPFALNATAPGGPVSFSVSSGPASIAVSGGVSILTITGAGQVMVQASQSGTTNYLAASNAPQLFTVNRAPQTITFPPISARVFPGPVVALGATATSGLKVSYNISGPAALTGPSMLSLTGTGTVMVTASQLGDANNLPATSQTQTFSVTAAPILSFAAWETQPGYFTTTEPSIIGLTAIPQRDGVANLLKYLYDINPAAPMTPADRAALPVFAMTTEGDLTLTYRQYTLLTGITVTVQTSSDLQNWTTVSKATTPTEGSYTLLPTGVADPNTGDPYMRVDFKPVSLMSKQFIRLNVTMP